MDNKVKWTVRSNRQSGQMDSQVKRTVRSNRQSGQIGSQVKLTVLAFTNIKCPFKCEDTGLQNEIIKAFAMENMYLCCIVIFNLMKDKKNICTCFSPGLLSKSD